MRRVSTILAIISAIVICAGSALGAPAAKVAKTKPAAQQATQPAFETAPTAKAATLLGDDVKGENWEVATEVRSDGFLYLFQVKTPYGEFQVNGLRRMKERINELRAVAVLEKMSRTERFANAVAHAGLAPVRFGENLILDPVETTGNVVSGVGKMFNNIYTGVKTGGTGRDPLFESVTGITKAERDLAAELNVDPYTDFTPLRKGLEDVAHVVAAGDLSVSAALSAIPGGAGIAVGATNTASTVAASIKDKTSLEIATMVSEKLKGLNVDEAAIKEFVANTQYTPSDQFAIADALETLKARNSGAFIASAKSVTSADAAKFTRYRAELLAKDSDKLGKLSDFELAADIAINHDNTRRLIAAFPFDVLYWTDTVANSMTKLSMDDKTVNRPRAYAITGAMSPMAEHELRKMGWAILKLP